MNECKSRYNHLKLQLQSYKIRLNFHLIVTLRILNRTLLLFDSFPNITKRKMPSVNVVSEVLWTVLFLRYGNKLFGWLFIYRCSLQSYFWQSHGASISQNVLKNRRKYTPGFWNIKYFPWGGAPGSPRRFRQNLLIFASPFTQPWIRNY